MQIKLIILVLSLCLSAGAVASSGGESILEGPFGSDGRPTDCKHGYYEGDKSLQRFCIIAQTENISFDSFSLAAILFQIEKTAEYCSFELKQGIVEALVKLKRDTPRLYDIAARYGKGSEIKSCDFSRYHMKDMLQ